MGRMVLAVTLALAATLCGCKKKPSYDLSSPEATLASFEKALDQKRIPQDLDIFLINPRELAAWKLRCRTRGCTSADFQAVRRERMADYTATLIANFTVRGEGGGIVMRGKDSPIRFAREQDRWLIEQFGEYVRARPRPARRARDAGPTSDGTTTSAPMDAHGAPATE